MNLFGLFGTQNKGGGAVISSPAAEPMRDSREFAGRGAAVSSVQIPRMTRAEERAAKKLNGPVDPPPTKAELADLTREEAEKLIREWQARNSARAKQEIEDRKQREIDRLVHGIHRFPHTVRDYERMGRYPTPDAFWVKVNFKPVRLEELLAAMTERERRVGILERYCAGAVKRMREENNAQVVEDLLAEKRVPINSPAGKNEVKAAFRERRKLLKLAVAESSKECADILFENARLLKEHCAAMADALEKKERAAWEAGEGQFGWPFVASRFLGTLRQLAAWRLDEQLPTDVCWHTNPRSMAAVLGIKL